MDIDAAIKRYLHNPDVARWLFSTQPVKTVPAKALDASFVYAIGWGAYDCKTPRAMNIEDMLIVTGMVDTYVLGVVWGLAQPHIFSRTPLMLDKKPLARRFAVDFSARGALEFMEFVSFDDGKMIVMFRQFLHTNDNSLPVFGCARLHSASQVDQTLGPVLMRADFLEATCCPRCGLVGKKCKCSFDSYAPTDLVRRSTHNWSTFTNRFMNKARVGAIKLEINAVLPNVGMMRIFDDDMPCVNVMQRGETEYMTLLRRKAVFEFGVDVIPPRAETLVLAKSLEHDFLDLHNSYVTRKRERESPDDADLAVGLMPNAQTLDLLSSRDLAEALMPSAQNISGGTDSMESVDDVLPTLFQGIFDSESNRYMDSVPDLLKARAGDRFDMFSVLPHSDVTAPLTKIEPVASPDQARTQQVTTSTTKPLLGERDTLDILKDIESILSPEGAQIQATENPSVPERDAVNAAFQAQEIEAPVQLSSSASSEHGDGNRNEAVPSQAKRKKTTAKRAKPSAAATGDSELDTEKKHACEHCTSRFKMRGDLLRHVKIVHEGKKMHTCKYCGKAFGHSGHLNRHISSVHYQERRFKCQFCGFQFFQQSHLQSHIGHIHAAKKSFACKKCSFRASNRSALKIHMEEHHSELEPEQFQCPYSGCLTSFGNENELTMHTIMTHRSNPVSLHAEAEITPEAR